MYMHVGLLYIFVVWRYSIDSVSSVGVIDGLDYDAKKTQTDLLLTFTAKSRRSMSPMSRIVFFLRRKIFLFNEANLNKPFFSCQHDL